jgi:acyl carrier protein
MDDQLLAEVIDKIKSLNEVGPDIAEDEDLQLLGLNSFEIMRLIVEFELIFEIFFEDEDLLIENFATPARMVEMIAKKRGNQNDGAADSSG